MFTYPSKSPQRNCALKVMESKQFRNGLLKYLHCELSELWPHHLEHWVKAYVNFTQAPYRAMNGKSIFSEKEAEETVEVGWMWRNDSADWYSFIVPLQTEIFKSRYNTSKFTQDKRKTQPQIGKTFSWRYQMQVRLWSNGTLHVADRCRCTVTLEKSLAVSYKVTYHRTQATSLLGSYPREMKTYVQKKSMLMLTAALFAITKNGKQPKCPSPGECGTSLQWNTTQWLSKASC